MAGMPRGIAWEVPGYYIQQLNPLAAGLYLARNGVAVFDNWAAGRFRGNVVEHRLEFHN